MASGGAGTNCAVMASGTAGGKSGQDKPSPAATSRTHMALHRMPRQSRAEAPAGASLAAFGVADQALLFRYLTLAQDVFPVLVRVLAFLEHEAHRRADQLEALAEEVLEIAAIGLGEGLQAGAVDDERRRVLGARMGETQLGDVAAYHRRRVGLVGDLERAGDFRGAELARGRIMCAMDGAEQLAQAGAVHRSEEHTSELQSLMRISYAVFCLKKKTHCKQTHISNIAK